MESINPMFQNAPSKKMILKNEATEIQTSTKRQTRSDKRHNTKFPVSPIMQMKLRTYCKQMGKFYQTKEGQPLTQTLFNTALLKFGLEHDDIINWGLEYEDTKTYMHTMLKEEQHAVIGGPYGLAIQKQLSERKVVFFIVSSVLKWIEKGGSLEEILQ